MLILEYRERNVSDQWLEIVVWICSRWSEADDANATTSERDFKLRTNTVHTFFVENDEWICWKYGFAFIVCRATAAVRWAARTAVVTSSPASRRSWSRAARARLPSELSNRLHQYQCLPQRDRQQHAVVTSQEDRCCEAVKNDNRCAWRRIAAVPLWRSWTSCARRGAVANRNDDYNFYSNSIRLVNKTLHKSPLCNFILFVTILHSRQNNVSSVGWLTVKASPI